MLLNFPDIKIPSAFGCPDQTPDSRSVYDVLKTLNTTSSQYNNFSFLNNVQSILNSDLIRNCQVKHPFNGLYQTEIVDMNTDGRADCGIADEDSEESVESQSDKIIYKYNGESTDTDDINAANAVFDRILRQRTPMFVWSLEHTDFEDGMSNSLTDEVEQYLAYNKYVTIIWLHTIFSKNQENQDVLAALLRIIAMTVNVDDSDKLMTLVIAGLNHPSSKTQEAAIAVIEEWRTKNCLDALRNFKRHTVWIGKYADVVERELEEELCSSD